MNLLKGIIFSSLAVIGFISGAKAQNAPTKEINPEEPIKILSEQKKSSELESELFSISYLGTELEPIERLGSYFLEKYSNASIEIFQYAENTFAINLTKWVTEEEIEKLEQDAYMEIDRIENEYNVEFEGM